MEKLIKSIAGSLAVLLFFVLAIAAWLGDCEPATCAYRAVTGAVVAYVVLSIAGRLAVKIVLDEMIEQKVDQIIQDHAGPRR